jgi:hypothetical protein
MSRIVAGRFDRSIDADAALAALQREGFRSGEYESFYVPPPGQHQKTPLGGDSYSDAGARKAGMGAGTGALIGAGVGGAAGAVAAGEFGVIAILLGAGVGAYVGSFAGGMSKVRSPKRGEASTEHPAEPAGGRMIAVNVDRQEMEPRALEVLRKHRARDVGRAEGTWRDGSWRDFDPRRPLGAA